MRAANDAVPAAEEMAPAADKAPVARTMFQYMKFRKRASVDMLINGV